MKKLLYLALLFVSPSVSAQYVTHGPGGGVVYGFYQDAGRTWLAANTGVFSSMDHGVSWSMPAALPSLMSCDSISSIAAFANELYAGSHRSGIYHSVDAGLTWSQVNNGIAKAMAYSDIEIIGPNALTIRSDSALYLTSDHGINWVRVNFAINQAGALWLSIHNNALYVTTSQGLFKSSDNGLTYLNINPNVSDIGELTWVNDTAYVSTSTGIKLSVDDGVSFNTIGLAGRATQNVAVYGSTIFATVRSAANRDTLKFSVNGGATFNNAPFPTAAPFSTVQDIVIDGTNVLVGSDYGLYTSSASSSISLRKADSGFYSASTRAMAVNGLRLYAATFPMGVFYTSDSGENWKHNGDLAHGLEGEMMAIDAKNQYVHAGGRTNYYRSSDFGLTWSAGATGLPAGTVNSIYASKTSQNVLVLHNGNLYRSSDDGGSFTAVSSPIPANSGYMVTQADTALFVASNSGLFKSGSNFVFAPTIGLTGLVTSVVYRAGNYYASTSGNGLFTSLDGGNWKPEVITAPGTLPSKLNALAVNNNVLIAASDDGLYSDSTGIWLQDSLRGMTIRSLAVMNGKLYAATCNGIWSLQNLPPTPVVGVNGMQLPGSSLQVYPNPSSGDFRAVLTAAKAGEGVLSLRNIMGHTVLQRSLPLHAGQNELQVSAAGMKLPAGVYLLQVATEYGVATQRIVLR